jgi:hypothetical protein
MLDFIQLTNNAQVDNRTIMNYCHTLIDNYIFNKHTLTQLFILLGDRIIISVDAILDLNIDTKQPIIDILRYINTNCNHMINTHDYQIMIDTICSSYLAPYICEFIYDRLILIKYVRVPYLINNYTSFLQSKERDE